MVLLKMEINSDAYECYLEDLRFRGVPVEDYDDVAKMGWYTTYLDKLMLEEDEQDLITTGYEPNEKILVGQLKDDVGQLVGQLQLLTQRLNRIEEQQQAVTNKIIERFK
jgi:hypothetical protein